MKFLETNDMLERMHNLIRMKATGSPAELASRLGVCERTVYNLIATFRDLGVPVAYSQERKTYYYESAFTIQFLKVQVENPNQITGGENKLNYFSLLQNFCSTPIYFCQ